MVAGFACGWRLMGGREQTAFYVEGDDEGTAHLFVKGGDDGFEVAEARAGLFARGLDAWSEGYVGFVEVDLLVGDFDHLIFGHAGGEDGA